MKNLEVIIELCLSFDKRKFYKSWFKKLQTQKIKHKMLLEYVITARMILAPTTVAIGITGYIFNTALKGFERIFVYCVFVVLLFALIYLSKQKVRLEEKILLFENKIKDVKNNSVY